jgi:predicted nucleotidyltransferase
MLNELQSLADRYHLSAVYAFGSRAKETAKRLKGFSASADAPSSDLDIGVQPELGRSLAAEERVELALALEKLFAVPRVDLVVLPEAGPFLALEVVKGELLDCRDYDRQAEDELYILRRAGDLARFEKERRRLILEEGGR